jgi:hypothetical protein
MINPRGDPGTQQQVEKLPVDGQYYEAFPGIADALLEWCGI